MHILHVFLFGLRIISKIISLTGDASKEILKIKNEDEEACVFSYPYNYKERIFYLWTLASTFHDIGYPLEYLPVIEKGFQDFTDFCKYSITPLYFQLDYTDIIELENYFKLISGMYGGILEFETINNDISIYKKIEHPYFYKVLISAFRERDHGVISSIILLRVIEDIFLFPSDGSKYPLNPTQFNKYMKFVFNNDIIRMALIISLHNMNRSKIPPIPKIKFSEFPLAFILILADELQEFLRRKTSLSEERILIRKIPDIDINFEDNILSIIIKYNLDDDEIIEIKNKTQTENLEEALKKFWEYSTKTLDNRLKNESKYAFILEMWKDTKVLYRWSLK